MKHEEGGEPWGLSAPPEGGEPWGLSAPPEGGEPWGLSAPPNLLMTRPRTRDGPLNSTVSKQ